MGAAVSPRSLDLGTQCPPQPVPWVWGSPARLGATSCLSSAWEELAWPDGVTSPGRDRRWQPLRRSAIIPFKIDELNIRNN